MKSSGSVDTFLQYLKNNRKSVVVVGAVGHRDLLDTPAVRAQVEAQLRRIAAEFPKKRLLLLTALAEGTDQLIAGEALEPKKKFPRYELRALLPAGEELCEGRFSEDHRKEFNKLLGLSEHRYILKVPDAAAKTLERVSELREKLKKDCELSRRSQDVDFQKVLPDAASELEKLEDEVKKIWDDQYVAVAKIVAETSDILLALWDGIYTGLPGGTSEVVRMAREGRDSENRALCPQRRIASPSLRHLSVARHSNRVPVRELYSWHVCPLSRKEKGSDGWRKARTLLGAHRGAVIPGLLVVLSVLLGWIGFYKAGNHGWDSFWKAVGLPALQTRVEIQELNRNRWSKGLLGSAAVLGGLAFLSVVIAAYLALFKDVKRRGWILLGTRHRWLRKVRARSRKKGQYSIVCGLGWKGHELVRELRQQKHAVTVIERDPQNSLIKSAESFGAVVLTGDATQSNILQTAKVKYASKVFIVCGSPANNAANNTIDHDETNSRILHQVAAQLPIEGDEDRLPKCYVDIRDSRRRGFVQGSIHKDFRARVNCFDQYEATARRLLREHPIDRFYSTLEGADTAHVILVGYTPMSQAILLQALRIGHFPDGPSSPSRSRRSLRCTVLSGDPEESRRDFLERFPCLSHTRYFDDPDAEEFRREILPLVDDNLRFVSLPRADGELLKNDSPLFRAMRPKEVISLYVCLDDGLQSASFISTVLRQLETLKSADQTGDVGPQDVQVFYYYNYPDEAHGSLVEYNLNQAAAKIGVIPFGNFFAHDERHRNDGPQLLHLIEEPQTVPQQINLFYDLMTNTKRTDSEGLRNLYRPLLEEFQEASPKQGGQDLHSGSDLLEKVFTAFLRYWQNGGTPPMIDPRAEGEQLWKKLTESERESNRLVADHIPVKLRRLHAHIELDSSDERPETDLKWMRQEDGVVSLAVAEHRRWGANMLLDGYRPLERKWEHLQKWHGNGDRDKQFKKARKAEKRHVALVSFDKLRPAEQILDYVQVLGIPAFLHAGGKVAIREPEAAAEKPVS